MGSKTKKNNPRKKLRRGRGEGSITYLESKKIWMGRVSDGFDSDGKRVVKYFYGSVNGKKTEVLRKMEEWKRQHVDGYDNISSDLLKDLIKEWLNITKRPVLKDGSYDRIESIINTHIIPILGEYKVGELTSDIIQRELINKMMKNYSLSSIRKVYDALNGFLRDTALKRQILFNPMATVVKPNVSHFDAVKVEIISDEDVRKFINVATSVQANGKPKYLYGQGYILILNTGIRMGEALALKWTDVDLDASIVTISRNAIMVKNRDGENGDGKRYLKMQSTPKSKSSNRVIHLNKAAVSALMSLKNESNSEYVISTKAGNAVHPAPFQKTLDRICANAGIERFGVHTLRHTFASKLIEHGVDIKVVSEILGHSGVRITYDIYVHILDKFKKNAVSVIDFL